jgi:hypothetical protein
MKSRFVLAAIVICFLMYVNVVYCNDVFLW